MRDWMDGMVALAINALEERGMADIFYGTVTSASPLQIRVEELKGSLSASQLRVAGHLTDYQTEMLVEGKRQKVTVYNHLNAGEKVLLFQRRGAQQYVVLDRYS